MYVVSLCSCGCMFVYLHMRACVCDSCMVSCEMQGESQIVMRQNSTLLRLKKMVRRGGGGGGGRGVKRNNSVDFM